MKTCIICFALLFTAGCPEWDEVDLPAPGEYEDPAPQGVSPLDSEPADAGTRDAGTQKEPWKKQGNC